MRWHCGAAHRWKGAAGGNLFRVDLRRQMKCDSQLREKLCTLSFYRPKSFEGNGDKHMGCRQQCIFGSLADSSLLSCRTCRDCCLRQDGTAQVWTTVASQAMYLPADQGMSVAPSGRLPSVRRRPDGS